MNKLYSLPRGFGAFPALELLDLTYNNLNEKSLPANFFVMGQYSSKAVKVAVGGGATTSQDSRPICVISALQCRLGKRSWF